MPILTIAIPTYNRNEPLAQTLRRLIPQLTKDCNLLIVDNASDTPVTDTVSSLLETCDASAVRILRNRVNIGGSANVVRCIELCETEWLWILGDDDSPTPDAVKTILESAIQHPQASFITFRHAITMQVRPFRTKGVTEFASALEGIGDVLFISTSIYNARVLQRTVAIGNHFGYSLGPHLAALLCSLGTDGECVFSPSSIVERRRDVPPEMGYSTFDATLGLFTLLELPIPPPARAALARAMAQVRPRPRELFAKMIKWQIDGAPKEEARFFYRVIAARAFRLDRNLLRRLELWLWLHLLGHPQACNWLLVRMLPPRFRQQYDAFHILRLNRDCWYAQMQSQHGMTR
jgi:abequosyltransferase